MGGRRPRDPVRMGRCPSWAPAGRRYAQTESKPSWVAIDGIPVGKEESSRYKWNEWQVDLSLSYQIDMLVPYIGAKYSQAKV